MTQQTFTRFDSQYGLSALSECCGVYTRILAVQQIILVLQKS